MRIVCIESPFRPSEDDIATYAGRYSPAELLRQNLVYAHLALVDSLNLGEAPLAAHLLYTQVTEQRDIRVTAAGIELHHRADLVALYVDLGMSSGRKLAGDNARLINTEQTCRSILDVRKGSDPREQLARYTLGTFPCFEELRRNETADEREPPPRLKAPGRVIPFRRPPARSADCGCAGRARNAKSRPRRVTPSSWRNMAKFKVGPNGERGWHVSA